MKIIPISHSPPILTYFTLYYTSDLCELDPFSTITPRPGALQSQDNGKKGSTKLGLAPIINPLLCPVHFDFLVISIAESAYKLAKTVLTTAIHWLKMSFASTINLDQASSYSAMDFDDSLDYNDMASMFNFDDLQHPEESSPVGHQHPEPLDGSEDIAEDPNQNDWMKVFVPSLLMAGFPSQIPSSEMQVSNSIHTLNSTTPVIGRPPIEILPSYSAFPSNISNISQSSLSSIPTNSPQMPEKTHIPTPSISTPLSLATLQYPFQTLDLYGNASTGQVSQSRQLPPPSPSSAMMQYLNFPETPRISGSGDQSTISNTDVIESGTTWVEGMFGQGTDPIPTKGRMISGRADAWDIFRTMPTQNRTATGPPQSGNKRKLGRKPFSPVITIFGHEVLTVRSTLFFRPCPTDW